jgi:hypothetical protein
MQIDRNFLEKNKPSEKNFGVVFTLVFFIVGVIFFIKNFETYKLMLALSIIFLIITLFLPQLFKLPNEIWFIIGRIISFIISPIILGFIFFLVITPISIIIKMMKIDIINQKLNFKLNSYWLDRDEKKENNSLWDQY